MKNFFDCKDGKITEKAFSQSLIISVVSILLCLVALCSMTYAWFTSETSSSSNTLMSGSFDLTINVSKVENDVAIASDIQVEPDIANVGKYKCTLEQGTYEISLTLTDKSNVKGHCVVKIGSSEEQHTAAIIGEQTANVDEVEMKTDPFKFKITVTETTEVTLEPRWGVVVDPDIQYGSTYPVPEVVDEGEITQDPSA
ncbi:MAG: hypothetical protein IJX80_09395 [Clostridia bacterium]|nr:hypothetical protein [Clostridia bacterium]